MTESDSPTIRNIREQLCSGYSDEDCEVIAVILNQSAFIESILDLYLHRLLVVPHGESEEEFTKRVDEINESIETMNINAKVRMLRAHLASKASLAARIIQLNEIRIKIAHSKFACGFNMISKDSIKVKEDSIWTAKGLAAFCELSQSVIKDLIDMLSNHQGQSVYGMGAEIVYLTERKEDFERQDNLSETDRAQLNFIKQRIETLKEIFKSESERNNALKEIIRTKNSE